MSEKPRISVVIPVYNEEESLPNLKKALIPELEALAVPFEVILCDDGSTDRSPELLEEWASHDFRVKVILFRRNFGQTAAMDAGFQAARGEVVVPMDADLQNDPADIGMLVAELDNGFDVVKGWRKKRKDTFITRTLPSRIANALISRVTEVKLHDYGCTLTAYRQEVLKPVRLYGEMHRFIPAYAVWAGGRIKEVPVNHHPRRFGQTKYNLSRTFRVILDLMTVRFLLGYSTKPLYLFGKWGLGFLFLSFLAFVATAAKKIMFWAERPLYTDPFLYLTIFLGLAGIQVLLIGLVAELNVRIYYESQDKSPFIVKSRFNMEDS